MESGKISDEQISASSSFYDGRWLPRMARLNNEDNAWTPAEDSNKEYIQVSITQTPLKPCVCRLCWEWRCVEKPTIISNRCVMDEGTLLRIHA